MKKRFLLSILTLILSFAYCHGGNPYTTLYMYGGKDGEVYLGKLNANEYDPESIWNEYGKYGNKYNSNSIWNEYGNMAVITASTAHSTNMPLILLF